MLLGTLRHVGDAWADPVGSVVALTALAAEALVVYLLVVVVLQGFALLPGALAGSPPGRPRW